jgi:hypothetical protein
MPSSGTGSEIPRDDARDLLSKLMTEATKVQALFRGRGGVSAGLTGILGRATAELLVVKPDLAPDAPFLAFNPNDAQSFMYAAGRAIPEPTLPDAPRFRSALMVIYPDGSQIALFEIPGDTD